MIQNQASTPRTKPPKLSLCPVCRLINTPPLTPELLWAYRAEYQKPIPFEVCPRCAAQMVLKATQKPKEPTVDLDAMFDYLQNVELPEGVDSFVESVHDKWEKGYDLSDKQKDAIRRIYFKAKKGSQ